MSELEEQIKVVVRARAIASDLIEAKNKSFAKWEEDNKSVIQAVVDVKARLDETEDTLRQLTLQAYAKDPTNKTPAKGVGIREVIKLDYDVVKAFDWAIFHEMALQLDKKAFEKIAKADTPDFVKVSTEAIATIATELKVE